MEALTARTTEELGEILDELVSNIKPVFGDKLIKVVLFGSYARGDFEAESDIDVMILVDESDQKLSTYAKAISEIVLDIDLKYEVLVAEIIQDYGKFTKYLSVLPFYQSVDKEGIVIYEQ